MNRLRPLRSVLHNLQAKAKVSRWWGLAGLALTLTPLFVSYVILNEIAATRGVTVFDPAQFFVFGGNSLDARIPYLPWTVVPYELLYQGMFLLAVFTYPMTTEGIRQLFRLFGVIIIITAIAFAIFLLCPAEMTLRAGAANSRDPSHFHDLNLLLHEVDRPFNTWPCLHVAQSGLIALVVSPWIGRRIWAILLLVAWATIAISTLTTKQHFLWDVMTGSLLALICWQWWKLRRPPIGTPTID
jgi:membrane-associated phospholipid phosphatase